MTGARGHNTNPYPLNQSSEMCRSDCSQKMRRFCLFLAAVVVFLVILVVVVLEVKLKSHQVESSQPSVQALAGGNQIYADAGKCLCWKEDASSKEPYYYYASTDIAALERLHMIDQYHSSCDDEKEETQETLKNCNVSSYDVAEKRLGELCDEDIIKCCHVRNYGLKYFNVSGNGNHQIASVICEDYEGYTPPIFQCQQGWGGKRCTETRQIQIGCRCFLSYGLCENTIDCSEVVYLNETMSLCRKHNLTHCESHVCRTRINDKECLCNVSTQWTQAKFINGAANLGRFTGIFTRNSLAIVASSLFYHLRKH